MAGKCYGSFPLIKQVFQKVPGLPPSCPAPHRTEPAGQRIGHCELRKQQQLMRKRTTSASGGIRSAGPFPLLLLAMYPGGVKGKLCGSALSIFPPTPSSCPSAVLSLDCLLESPGQLGTNITVQSPARDCSVQKRLKSSHLQPGLKSLSLVSATGRPPLLR